MSRLEAISREILSQARTTIVLNMRFMDMAVFRLNPMPADVTLATDGERLYYGPVWLLKRYRDEANAVARDCLHVLLHCVFRHPFVNAPVDEALWNLACDIAVEGLICEFNRQQFATRPETKRRAVADMLRGKVAPLTAEKLYHYFRTHSPDPDWAALFRADDHAIWHSPARARELSRQAREQERQGDGEERPRPDGSKEPDQDEGQQPPPDSAPGDGDSGNGGADGPNQNAGQQARPESAPGDGDSGNGGGQSDSSPDGSNQDSGGQQAPSAGQGSGSRRQRFQPPSAQDGGGGPSEPRSGIPSRRSLEEEWRDISERVQMDLETFAKAQGLQAGDMAQLLAELNRERYDYEAFLKKFAVMGEVMKLNDDEFDYIFYTYGLKLFGNMPLVEPLEYREARRVREFVIAIDTSGSTSGELVNRFLTKTYNILMATESFFSKVNIHIIQCDAQIQEAVKLTCREEFEDYLRHMTVRGQGGTDFRPVFGYVDQMIRQHEFKRLKGLIYFTDVLGTFPTRKPDYSAAFVFVQDRYNNLNVPPWAIKLILEKEEL